MTGVRIKTIITIVALVCAFPIYISNIGIQTTHIFVYPIFLTYFRFVYRDLLAFVIVCSVLIGTLLFAGDLDLGTVDAFFLFSVSVLLTDGMRAKGFDFGELRRWLAFLGLMAILTLPYQFFYGIPTWFELFSNAQSDLRLRSLNNFRYIGIFGSPFEAGVFVVLWFWYSKGYIPSFVRYLVFLIGGLTLSKAWMLGFAFIFISIIYKAIRYRKFTPILISISSIVFLAANLDYFIPDYILGGIVSGDVKVLTAGRFGGGQTTIQSNIAFSNLVLIEGFIKREIPMDNTVFFLVKNMGLLGLIYIVLYFGVFRKILSRVEIMYLILASLGAPVMFKNLIFPLLLLRESSN